MPEAPGRKGCDVVLHVGTAAAAGVDAGPALQQVGGQQTLSTQEVVEPVAKRLQSLISPVQTQIVVHARGQRRADMILIVGADLRRVLDDIDAMAVELARGPMPESISSLGD